MDADAKSLPRIINPLKLAWFTQSLQMLLIFPPDKEKVWIFHICLME